MTEALGSAILELGVDDTELRRGLDDSEKSTRSTISRAGKGMMKAGAGLSLGLTAPILAFGKVAADELGEITAANAQTEAALKSVGAQGRVTAGDIQGMAMSLQKLSGFDDQAIQQGENLILMLGGLDVSTKQGEETFRRAGAAAVDMAAALKSDPVTASKTLGKALADPEKGASRLARAGIMLTDQQKDQVKAFMDSGDKIAAQGVLLTALEGKFQGAGAAAGQKFPAQIAVLKDSFAGAGAELLLVFMPTFQKLVGILQGAMTAFSGLDPHVKTAIAVIGLLVAVAGPLLMMVGSMVTGLTALAGVLAAVSLPVVGVVAALVLLGIGLVALWKQSDEFRTAVTNAFEAMKAAVSQVLDGLKATITVWVGWARELWSAYGEQVKSVATRVWSAVSAVIGGYLNSIASVVKAVLAVLRGDWSGAWENLKDAAGSAFSALKAIVSLHIDALKAILSTAWTLISSAATGAWGGIKDSIVGFVSGIPGAVWGALTGEGGVAAKLSTVGQNAMAALKAGLATVFNAKDGVEAWVAGLPAALWNLLTGKGGLADKFASVAAAAGQALKDGIKGAINAIIDMWNGLSFSIPPKKIKGKTIFPGVSIGTPDIPHLADGGIVTGPTLALIGEGRSHEAVVPLDEYAVTRRDAGGRPGPFIGTMHVDVHDTDVDVPQLVRRMNWHARTVGAY